MNLTQTEPLTKTQTESSKSMTLEENGNKVNTLTYIEEFGYSWNATNTPDMSHIHHSSKTNISMYVAHMSIHELHTYVADMQIIVTVV